MIQILIGTTLAWALLLASRFLVALGAPTLSNRLVSVPQTIKVQKSIASWFHLIVLRFAEPKKKLQRVLFELPDFLDLLAVALHSGEGLYSAMKRVVPRLNGLLGNELAATLRALEFGSGIEVELLHLSQRLPQRQLVEMCNKLILASRRGTPLAQTLVEQAEAVRQEMASQVIKQAGKNETRMLVPLVFLILPVTVLFAIYPSLELLNITYL